MNEVEGARYMLRERENINIDIQVEEPKNNIKKKKGRTWDSKAFVTAPHASRRYFSRYFGKSVAKEDSSRNVPPLLSASANLSTLHYGEGEMN